MQHNILYEVDLSDCILQMFIRGSEQSLYLIELSGLTEFSDVFKGFKGLPSRVFWNLFKNILPFVKVDVTHALIV